MTQESLKTPIYYPEPDGTPMAESDLNRDYLIYGVESLKNYFQNRSDVYVSGNLWLSYQQGVPDAVVAPDVFVVFGVENRQRRTYKVWEENGKTPDFVLEVTSRSTRHKDDQENPRTYAQMGVTEYFQYDPMRDYLNPLLKGRRLTEDGYQIIAPHEMPDGTLCLTSQVLGLEMRLLTDGRFRFFHPQTGEYLLTYGEQERQRVALKRQRADRERLEKEHQTQRGDRPQEKADRLAAKLRELGIDPDAD